jgi:hypothetical protein
MPIRVAGRVIICWAAALLVCAVVGAAIEFDDILVVAAMAVFSLPLLALAIVASVTFSHSIARHPELWGLAAVTTGLLVSVAVLGRVALVGSYAAMPAAVGFAVWMRIKPLRT